ncbi:MAG TPA: DNA methyltransferase [Pyrinomonadaceae bacterium]|nr:DNA methyltransferase [Pyrinomonadaceae bacterium]
MANAAQLVTHLKEFNFESLFIELGWSASADRQPRELIVGEITYRRRQIAQLSGVSVFEITAPNGEISEKSVRKRIHHEVSRLFHENLLIFLDENRSQSVWLWVKREKGKQELREHDYFKNQPVDLMLSKIMRMNFELEEFDDEGNPPPIVVVARKLRDSLDIERVTKKFFVEFQNEHAKFLEFIEGIENERDRRWYASVVLNRLMFIYFLQEKRFIDGGRQRYLQTKLADSKESGEDLYFKNFLWKLFFVGFAKPEATRTTEDKELLGFVPYLNGGLFLPHRIEIEYKDQIKIADEAFENIFNLFQSYSWNLDDTPGGKADEINPDVLGYIFEKYINQKAFGAYYTRPEITQYLCEQTIYKVILDQVNSLAAPPDGRTPNMFSSNDGGLFLERTYDSMADLLLYLDEFLCRQLWFKILPDLKLIDPSCGSGAFLVAAMKTLLNVYSAVIGKMETLGDETLKNELEKIRSAHPTINYDIKKRIITNNLYGVDIMEEATEIAKLRLFMTLVSSVHRKEELEPLPNIDFNILAGNSLIGILKVNAEGFDNSTGKSKPSLFEAELSQSYQAILDDKNKSIEQYKNHIHNGDTNTGQDENARLLKLREHIDEIRQDSYSKLNQLLLGDFKELNIKFEQATWDEKKQKVGRSEKRELTVSDIEALHPFHWGFEFDEILNKKGGFDAIITNPPWEIFKPIAKEFCYEYDSSIERRGTNIKDFEQKLKELLKSEEVLKLWLEYQSGFPHVNLYFRNSAQYRNQISYIDGAKAKIDINLYKLFLEQCFNLLRKNGECGIVIPSGIYSDLGAKQLREMLFQQTEITGLFCFENRKVIFEGVDSRFKFVVLTFRKGGVTKSFPSAFMRHEVRELEQFPRAGALPISVELIKKLSPDSLSVMEFKNESEIQIAEKMLKFPSLGTNIKGKWNLDFGREFHMTDDAPLFNTENAPSRFPLYEGKMIWHFGHGLSEFRYWVEEKDARKKLLSQRVKTIKRKFAEWQKEHQFNESDVIPSYTFYRIGFRAITGATNERALVVSILPKNVFTGNSLNVSDALFDSFENQTWRQNLHYTSSQLLFAAALMSSFICDWFIRNKILTNMNMFYLYQLPVPRLIESDKEFAPIVERAAKLFCTTPDYDDLAEEVGIGSCKNGITNETHRQQIRAELDALIAHLYGITEDEFTYILSTFPLVPDTVKIAAQHSFRTVKH